MGIVRYNLHKRRVTGARKKSFRGKKIGEIGRPAANTKLGKLKIRPVRVRGGNIKLRALRLNTGNFAWGSEAIAKKTRILDVVYNATNNELVRTKTLVKGAIVLIDAAPFRHWYEKYYNEALAKTKDVVEDSKLSKSRLSKVEKRRKDHEIDPLLKEQFGTGKLLAIIRTSPGQIGRADGYILEGPELAFYLRKLQTKKKTK